MPSFNSLVRVCLHPFLYCKKCNSSQREVYKVLIMFRDRTERSLWRRIRKVQTVFYTKTNKRWHNRGSREGNLAILSWPFKTLSNESEQQPSEIKNIFCTHQRKYWGWFMACCDCGTKQIHWTRKLQYGVIIFVDLSLSFGPHCFP